MAEISVMKHEDLIDVVPIERLCFGDRWSVQAFGNELDNPASTYFVARENDKIVGYAGFWLILDEAHITTIATHPQWQRRSIGEQMLLTLIDAAREKGAKWLTLEVRVSNASAQRLYAKYGFTALGRRRGYYQDDGEDALVMWTENIWDVAYRERLERNRTDLARRVAALPTQQDA